MISALLGGFTEFARKPLYFVLSLVGIALNATVLLLSLESYQNVFISVVVFGEVPNVPLAQLPFYFTANYLTDLFVIGTSLLFSLAIGFMLLFAYSRMLTSNKPSLREGIVFAASRIMVAIGFAGFSFVAVFLYSVVAFFLFTASISFELVGTLAAVLLLLWLLFGLYLYTKLVFTPLFISIDEMNLKKALAESWKWSSGKFVPLIVFLVLAAAAGNIIAGASSLIGESIVDEAISATVIIIGVSLSNAYYNIVFTKFFVESRH